MLWGAFDANMTSRYDDVEQYVPLRIIVSNKSKTREDWKRAIGNAHKVRLLSKWTLITVSIMFCCRNTVQGRQRSRPRCGT